MSHVNALIDLKFSVRSGFANREILKSYLALLCMSKSNFDAIENFRENALFKRGLVLGTVPSNPILRQRMDTHAAFRFDMAPQLNQLLPSSRINGQRIGFGTLACGYTPVALDIFTLDNSGIKIELLRHTYAGVKWNPRASPVGAIATKRVAGTSAQWVSARAGKRGRLWQEILCLRRPGRSSRAQNLHRTQTILWKARMTARSLRWWRYWAHGSRNNARQLGNLGGGID